MEKEIKKSTIVQYVEGKAYPGGQAVEAGAVKKEDVDNLAIQLINLRKEFDKNKKSIRKEIKKVRSYHLKIIETLGIFVALFTFISVEFQILRGIDNLDQAILLSLILLGSLGMFLSLLSYCIGRFFYENSFRLTVFLVSIIILILGIFMAEYPFENEVKDKKMNFNSNYSESRK